MAIPYDDCREPKPSHPASELVSELDRRELERLRRERTEVEKEIFRLRTERATMDQWVSNLQDEIQRLNKFNEALSNRCHAQSEALSGRATSAYTEQDACIAHLTTNAADLARKGMVDIAHVVACLAEDIRRGEHRK